MNAIVNNLVDLIALILVVWGRLTATTAIAPIKPAAVGLWLMLILPAAFFAALLPGCAHLPRVLPRGYSASAGAGWNKDTGEITGSVTLSRPSGK